MTGVKHDCILVLVDLEAEASIADRFRAVAVIAPRDSFPPSHLAKMDDYLGRGGKMLVALNRVEGDLQNLQGIEVSTGLETWLETKGVIIDKSFAIDENCGAVQAMQQRQVGWRAHQLEILNGALGSLQTLFPIFCPNG